MLSQEDKLLIDRYLDNSLTGLELRDFLSRLETDEKFKREVSFHNMLVEGITEAENKRLVLYISQSTGYKKRLIPFSLTLIFTFLLVTFGGIIFWDYIGPGSSGIKHNYFSWNFLRHHNLPATPAIPVQKIDTHQTKEPAAENPVVMEKTDTMTAQDIVVKKDQLLVTYQLQPIRLITDPATASAGEDKSSDVPATDRSTLKFDVEFWVSPVNYKGYKLAGNKLILFGIELPDEIQLYAIDQTLWLKYGHDFYQLESSDNFESLIASNDIPSQLK
jgi:hypothetical protein